MAARWRLTQKHYLNVPGTEYEYRETSSAGKAIRKRFEVPQFLDPEAPSDQNYPGEIIVAQGSDALPKDIIFVGNPTPDMAPLTPEAERISKEYMAGWGQPAVDMGDEGYTANLLRELTMTLNSFNATAAPSSASGELTEMRDQMKQLMAMNMALIAKLEPVAALRR